MNQRFNTNKLEVYWLPDGGVKGKDEIGLHSNIVNLAIHEERRDFIYAVSEQAPTWWKNNVTINIESMGLFRDVPYFVRNGGRGIVTLLAGHQPFARHCEANILSFEIGFGFGDMWSWKANLNVLGMLYDGTYTVQNPYAHIQTDMGDGTLLERTLYHDIPLDQYIDNRFHGWSS